ncbi:MAG: response regulator [Verrucomicrobiae bacterium]|nr:response regulator [Verrucomicrobiae bacterium]
MAKWVNLMQTKTQNIRTIVVIDDDVWLAKALSQVLGQNHFIVHVFQSGWRALECLALERVDLVITDIYMDHMDGIEIVRKVKASFSKVKIIVMSGGSQVVDLDCLAVAKMIGADRALEKPVQIDGLLQAIRELDAEL